MAEEKLGKSEVFDSFESNVQEEISVPKAEKQEAKAEDLRKEK